MLELCPDSTDHPDEIFRQILKIIMIIEISICGEKT